MGFGFLSMTARAGVALDPPVDVFVHQVRPILVTLPREGDVGARIQGWAVSSALGLKEIKGSHCEFSSLPWHPSFESPMTLIRRELEAESIISTPSPFRQPLWLTTCLLPLSPGQGAGR